MKQDPAKQIAQANNKFGLLKLKKYGIKFTPSLDLTITRNKERFLSGFSYGGMFEWNKNISLPCLKPNACGMIMAIFNKWPNENSFLKKCIDLSENKDWDIQNGNHFILLGDIIPKYENCKHFIIYHGGSGDKNKLYNQPEVLKDNKAEKYYNTYLMEQGRSQLIRYQFVNDLIKEPKVIFNRIHQGLIKKNKMVLGCYWFDKPSIFPLTLNPNENSYLFQGVGLMPHGGGYSLPQYKSLNRVFEYKGRRLFKMKLYNGSKEIFEYPNSSYQYRGKEILKELLKNKNVKLLAKLKTRLSIKC